MTTLDPSRMWNRLGIWWSDIWWSSWSWLDKIVRVAFLDRIGRPPKHHRNEGRANPMGPKWSGINWVKSKEQDWLWKEVTSCYIMKMILYHENKSCSSFWGTEELLLRVTTGRTCPQPLWGLPPGHRRWVCQAMGERLLKASPHSACHQHPLSGGPSAWGTEHVFAIFGQNDGLFWNGFRD